MGREFSWRIAGASAVLSVVVATLAAWLFKVLILLF
jgi:hypothetical protein